MSNALSGTQALLASTTIFAVLITKLVDFIRNGFDPQTKWAEVVLESSGDWPGHRGCSNLPDQHIREHLSHPCAGLGWAGTYGGRDGRGRFCVA
jgi:hypothetical protein